MRPAKQWSGIVRPVKQSSGKNPRKAERKRTYRHHSYLYIHAQSKYTYSRHYTPAREAVTQRIKNMRQPTDPIMKPKQMIHLRMPPDLYQRLRELAAFPEEYNGITGIVIRAVREYVDRTYLGELSFTQWYVRTSKYHRRPSAMEKAITYAGRLPMQSLGLAPREVAFFSATLRYHHDHDIWNAHTHAMVNRERTWLQARGLRIPGDMPIEDWCEADLPQDARNERPPGDSHE